MRKLAFITMFLVIWRENIADTLVECMFMLLLLK